MFKFLKRNSTAPTVPDTTPAPASNKIDFGWLVNVFKKQPGEFVEPWTLARARLEGKARDKGADAVRPMYNAHKTKVRNQWVNPLQSVNSGYSTVQMSFFLYQTVNYYECYALAQDPLFAKVFNLLSETPFSKGGEIVMPEGADIDRNALDVAVKKHDVWGHIVRGVRSSYVSGGCLVYMDFGLSPDELAKPLRLSNMDMRRFKGFRHIDPINVVALDVDTVNPVSADYMNPKQWYVIGLGNVHRSHFLKFEANIPELVMRPLTLYFGMPLTQLIKQDVANSNLASQGVANLMNRFRNLYLTMEDSAFATANAESLKSRLEFMSLAQDNFMVCPLKSGESVQQLTMSLTGVADNLEMFYLLVSAKTDIPYTELMGKSAQGMDASGAGDRRKWYDKCVSIQAAQHDTILTMYGICAGTIAGDGKFVKFPDYTFNPLEESSEKERAENLRSYTEVARTLIDLGATSEDVFNWLKSFTDFHLDDVEFDADIADDYEDITDDVLAEWNRQGDKV